jgi:hypothetical protein
VPVHNIIQTPLWIVTAPGFVTLKDLYLRSQILNEFKYENEIQECASKPFYEILKCVSTKDLFLLYNASTLTHNNQINPKIKKGYKNLVRLSL